MDNQFIRVRIVVQVNGKRKVLLSTGVNRASDNHDIVLSPVQLGDMGKLLADRLKEEGIDCCPIVMEEGENNGDR